MEEGVRGVSPEVVAALHGYFGKEMEDALKTRRWERIEFVAERPARPIFGVLGSKTHRKTLAKPCGA